MVLVLVLVLIVAVCCCCCFFVVGVSFWVGFFVCISLFLGLMRCYVSVELMIVLRLTCACVVQSFLFWEDWVEI